MRAASCCCVRPATEPAHCPALAAAVCASRDDPANAQYNPALWDALDPRSD